MEVYTLTFNSAEKNKLRSLIFLISFIFIFIFFRD